MNWRIKFESASDDSYHTFGLTGPDGFYWSLENTQSIEFKNESGVRIAQIEYENHDVIDLVINGALLNGAEAWIDFPPISIPIPANIAMSLYTTLEQVQTMLSKKTSPAPKPKPLSDHDLVTLFAHAGVAPDPVKKSEKQSDSKTTSRPPCVCGGDCEDRPTTRF